MKVEVSVCRLTGGLLKVMMQMNLHVTERIDESRTDFRVYISDCTSGFGVIVP